MQSRCQWSRHDFVSFIYYSVHPRFFLALDYQMKEEQVFLHHPVCWKFWNNCLLLHSWQQAMCVPYGINMLTLSGLLLKRLSSWFPMNGKEVFLSFFKNVQILNISPWMLGVKLMIPFWELWPIWHLALPLWKSRLTWVELTRWQGMDWTILSLQVTQFKPSN